MQWWNDCLNLNDNITVNRLNIAKQLQLLCRDNSAHAGVVV